MTDAARVLVVDDDAGVVAFLVEVLEDAGFRAEGLSDPAEALARVEAEPFDLVVSDVEMPGLRGPDLMRAIHARRPDQLVLLMTAFGSVDMAVDAVRAGACDFVSKPFSPDRIVLAVERALEERRMRRQIVRLRRQLPGGEDAERIVARSPAMQRVCDLARRAARGGVTVLLGGESGVGKNVVARLVHDAGDRAGGPFVQVNCAALPEALVESELFGVRRGAFTDAREDRRGLLVEADGGTLFLDEVTEMPLGTQPKLLDVLETGRVRAVGAGEPVAVDVRFVAATNAAIEQAVADGRFRSDLYYRLNVVRIEVPPLRSRPEDVEPLVELLLERACARQGRGLLGVSASAWRWLRTWRWPGNVRELANTIERAVALAEHDTLTLDDVRPPAPPAAGEDFLAGAVAAGMRLADLEATYIDRVLQHTGGNKVEAAQLLGIDRRTLYRRLEARDDD
ncbi:MAG: sigma-54-dependent Fis family transcriptional regulator [Myxococcales bacterium]|nr:sigma-54-dependent Fis family transcriptional regulator [Myxococcales bacterium]